MSIPVSLALFFDSTGIGEWLVLGVVILIVVGPKRLPEAARKVGKMMEMFRRAADEFRRQLLTMDQEPYQPPEDPPRDPAPDESQTDADGVPNSEEDPYSRKDGEDPYAESYPDDAGYPGNEDQVEQWSSDHLSDYPDGRPESGDATDTGFDEDSLADRAETDYSETGEPRNRPVEEENAAEEKKA